MTLPSSQQTLVPESLTATINDSDANRKLARSKLKQHFAGILDALVEKALEGNVPAIKLVLDIVMGNEKHTSGEQDHPSGIEEFHSKHSLKQ